MQHVTRRKMWGGTQMLETIVECCLTIKIMKISGWSVSDREKRKAGDAHDPI